MKKTVLLFLTLGCLLVMFTACTTDEPIVDVPNDTSEDIITPISTPAPTEPPIVLNPAPLTGLEKEESEPTGEAPIAVMINNTKLLGADAFPQWGIGDADVIYEMVTEGGTTSLMAVFPDYREMDSVGPVSSSRDQHVQLMLPYNPLFVHEGGSHFAERMLGEKGYDSKDFTIYPYATRNLYNYNSTIATDVVKWDSTMYTERNGAVEMSAYTSAEMINQAILNGADNSTPTIPLFNFVPYDQDKITLYDGSADHIRFQYSGIDDVGYYTEFEYDQTTGAYLKTNTKGEPHIDASTGEQLSFDNVFVLFAPVTPYSELGFDAGGLSCIDLSQGGYGHYFSNGTYEKVRWMKGLPHEPLRIVDIGGNEIDIQVNTGKSYIGVTDYSMFEYCEINNSSFNTSLQ